ncbi:MAG: cobyrinate a,c-diamide synthase [Proteobacteria bacterium]|nr:cobyrinate a,c-diamide synthase [Pseudomonadota bacterium]MBU1737685.1 cobyrinate a,c-diamide synthase [Pseudomonadota bacterium]
MGNNQAHISETPAAGAVIAGLSGGSGKSVVAVGAVAALARRGHTVMAFKKGPDYIDSGWLGLAAGRPCFNLDPYLMKREVLLNSFYTQSCLAEYVLVEGNRGLFDGVDLEGAYSTAELAFFLKLPVILVVDCTKTTRTVAALVAGCQRFDRRIEIRGVVLNRVGTSRHESIVRRSVEHYTGIPVLGAFPRSREDVFPQRHLGITPGPEHADAGVAVATLADRAEKFLDLGKLMQMMAPVSCPEGSSAGITPPFAKTGKGDGLKIGLIRDEAFQFYYQENLDALQNLGVELIEINAITEKKLPEIDALYIGGGFPETSARALSENMSFLASLREMVEKGLPVYAECGGLIFLGRSISLEGEKFTLAGIFPVDFTLERKPQAHGYTDLVVTADNPFYPLGTEISGHEFRYSKVVDWEGKSDTLACRMDRGVGFAEKRDGLVYKNVFALYTHVHSLGTPEWAPGMVQAARKFKDRPS